MCVCVCVLSYISENQPSVQVKKSVKVSAKWVYRDETYSLQSLLSRTQAGPGTTVKKEQEEISPIRVQRLNLISVQWLPVLPALQIPIARIFLTKVLCAGEVGGLWLRFELHSRRCRGIVHNLAMK